MAKFMMGLVAIFSNVLPVDTGPAQNVNDRGIKVRPANSIQLVWTLSTAMRPPLLPSSLPIPKNAQVAKVGFRKTVAGKSSSSSSFPSAHSGQHLNVLFLNRDQCR